MRDPRTETQQESSSTTLPTQTLGDQTRSSRITPTRTPSTLISTSNTRLQAGTRISRQTLTRRKRWLEGHPEYFASVEADAELAEPLAYDRLVRQHQTPAEREAEGRKRGWASVLESSLARGQARRDQNVADTATPSGDHINGSAGRQNGVQGRPDGADTRLDAVDWSVDEDDGEDVAESSLDGQHGEIQAQTRIQAQAREHALSRWQAMLSRRFLDGLDDNFIYEDVDNDEALDEDWLGQRAQEEYFETEEEKLEGGTGETGIQDF